MLFKQSSTKKSEIEPWKDNQTPRDFSLKSQDPNQATLTLPLHLSLSRSTFSSPLLNQKGHLVPLSLSRVDNRRASCSR